MASARPSTNQTSANHLAKSQPGKDAQTFDAPNFSNVDEVTECHDGVCDIKKCVNGDCSETKEDMNSHKILESHRIERKDLEAVEQKKPMELKKEVAPAPAKKESLVKKPEAKVDAKAKAPESKPAVPASAKAAAPAKTPVPEVKKPEAKKTSLAQIEKPGASFDVEPKEVVQKKQENTTAVVS